jgi:hypothetical protein
MEVRKASFGICSAKKMETAKKHAIITNGLRKIHSRDERKETGFKKRFGIGRLIIKSS